MDETTSDADQTLIQMPETIGNFKSELDKLKEKELIWFGMKIMIVLLVLGIVSMFIPYVYAIIPAYSSQVCLCNFYKEDSSDTLKLTSAQVFKTI